MTVLEALQSINAFWVPLRTVEVVAMNRGLDPRGEMSAETLKGSAFNLCKADLWKWLSQQPNVSQGGQSYSFTDEQRKHFRQAADAIYETLEPGSMTGVKFGYKGDRL